jgi:hypothetical protein
MSKYRQQKDEDGDRYWGPSIITLIVIGIAVLILLNSTSPRTGITTAAIFLIAVGLAVMVVRKFIR